MKEPLPSKTEKELNLRFNLKQVCQQDKPAQLMLATTIEHRRIRVYTGIRIEPKYWDSRKARCSYPNNLNLRDKKRLMTANEHLDRLVHLLNEADARLAQSGEPLSHPIVRQVVQRLKRKTHAPQGPIVALRRLAEDYGQGINRRGSRGNENSAITYLSSIRRLELFDSLRANPLNSFDDFTPIFFDDFRNFLCDYTYGRERKHYTQNTIINTLKVIKNLLHRAYDSGLTANNTFLKVQTTLHANASEQIYLKESEIRRLASVPTLNREEREVRDMFVIACYTALRFSDIQRLDTALIRQGRITLYQQKTKDKAEIPILKEIEPLVSHYRQTGFPTLNKAHVNRILRTLAARCRIDDNITRKEMRGGETRILTLPKHRLISFHTARRSCITNLYLRGYAINYIMVISGHRSIQALQRYMRASNEEIMDKFMRLLKKDKAL